MTLPTDNLPKKLSIFRLTQGAVFYILLLCHFATMPISVLMAAYLLLEADVPKNCWFKCSVHKRFLARLDDIRVGESQYPPAPISSPCSERSPFGHGCLDVPQTHHILSTSSAKLGATHFPNQDQCS